MSLDYEPAPKTYLSLWRGEILAPVYRLDSVKSIIAMVADRHGVEASDIIGPRRTRNIAYARQEAMYVCRSTRRQDGSPRYSYPEIGRRMGDRDHTTVLHGVRAHAARHGLEVPA